MERAIGDELTMDSRNIFLFKYRPPPRKFNLALNKLDYIFFTSNELAIPRGKSQSLFQTKRPEF